MTTLDDVRTGAFFEEIEKLGARRGLKIIRQLLEEGTPEALEKARRLGATSGVLKDVAGGHQVKRLGRGSEGLAEIVAGARSSAAKGGGEGIAVRKIYDPNSPIASPEIIKRRVQMSKELEHPALAKTFGAGKEGVRDVSYHEFVPGKMLQKRESTKDIQDMVNKAREKGWFLGDVRGPNVVGGKAIDYIPFREGEFRRQMFNMLDATPEGMKLLGKMPGRGGAPVGSHELLRGAVEGSRKAHEGARGFKKARGARSAVGEATKREGSRYSPPYRRKVDPGPTGPDLGTPSELKNVDPWGINARRPMTPGVALGYGLGGAGAGGAAAYTLKGAPEKKQKVAARLQTAWDGGLRDELQKIATLTGRVASFAARQQVVPTVEDVLERAEESARQKMMRAGILRYDL